MSLASTTRKWQSPTETSPVWPLSPPSFHHNTFPGLGFPETQPESLTESFSHYSHSFNTEEAWAIPQSSSCMISWREQIESRGIENKWKESLVLGQAETPVPSQARKPATAERSQGGSNFLSSLFPNRNNSCSCCLPGYYVNQWIVDIQALWKL